MYTNVNELVPTTEEKIADASTTGGKPFYQVQPINSTTAKIVEIAKLRVTTDDEFGIPIDTCEPEHGKPDMAFFSCIHPVKKQMMSIIQLRFMKDDVPFAYLSYNFIKESDKPNDQYTGYFNITYHEEHNGMDCYRIIDGRMDWISTDHMFAALLEVVS